MRLILASHQIVRQNPQTKNYTCGAILSQCCLGRVVQPGGDSDAVSSSREAFTPGVSVSATSRTNIGCYNDGFQSSSPQTIFADLYTASGSLLNTYTLNLPVKGWSQFGISDTVSGDQWRPLSLSSCYCYAVVVDNNSNDGTFIPALSYIP